MKMLLLSLLFVSLNTVASVSSDEPMVNFDGTYVGITETCLTSDGQHLRTTTPVKVIVNVKVGDKVHSRHVDTKFLETSLSYVAQGECLSPGVKLGMCHKRAPNSHESYDLSGSFAVYKMERIGDKISVRRFVKMSDYSVENCPL